MGAGARRAVPRAVCGRGMAEVMSGGWRVTCNQPAENGRFSKEEETGMKKNLFVALVILLLVACAPAPTVVQIPTPLRIPTATILITAPSTMATRVPTEIATQTVQVAPTATETIVPTATATLSAREQLQRYLNTDEARNLISRYANAKGIKPDEVTTRLQLDAAILRVTDSDGKSFEVCIDPQTEIPLFIQQNGIWQGTTQKSLFENVGIQSGTNIRTAPINQAPPNIEQQARTIGENEFNLAVIDRSVENFFSEGPQGFFHLSAIQEELNEAAKTQMITRGQPLVYGRSDFKYNQWFKDALQKGILNKDSLTQIMVNHVKTLVSQFKGQMNQWVLVNEVGGEDPYWDIIGKDYPKIALQTAIEADANAYLIYNYDENKADGSVDNFTYDNVKELKAIGLEGLGLQFHLDASQPHDKQKIIAMLRKYAELGVDIHITELDVKMVNVRGTEAERQHIQDDTYRTVIQAIIESKVVKSVAFWETTYGDQYSWLERDASKSPNNEWNSPNNQPTLYTVDNQGNIVPKSAYYETEKAVLGELRK